MVDQPLVSIGMPLYNSDRWLREALDSLIGQDYPNFELIISDNGSEDATREICESYAARDPRVKYHRTEENVGAIWNFNHVFELARGEYFMWAAHDDIRSPRFLSACIAAMRAHPDAVLCCTGVEFIDEDGRELKVPPHIAGNRPVGPRVRDRVREVARACNWYDFYGLTTPAALRKTRLAVPTWGFDVVIGLELCLLGPVLLVPEPLFAYRLRAAKTEPEMAGGLAQQGAIGVCWSCMALELLRAIWLSPYRAPTRTVLASSFLVNFCVLNWRAAAHLRRDLAPSVRSAFRERRWGAAAILLVMSALVYPLYNRFTRAIFRRTRGTSPAAGGSLTTP